jgi:peptidoglycan/LPS O-acetylase OafA/YrhL
MNQQPDLIRWDRINTLRGLACLLVVAFHVLGQASPRLGGAAHVAA